MLEHRENFESGNEYEEIELHDLTEEVVLLIDNHIDNKLLFHGDYKKIQNLFNKSRYKHFFYMSKSAKEIEFQV